MHLQRFMGTALDEVRTQQVGGFEMQVGFLLHLVESSLVRRTGSSSSFGWDRESQPWVLLLIGMAMLKLVANEPGLRNTVSTASAVLGRKTGGMESEGRRAGEDV